MQHAKRTSRSPHGAATSKPFVVLAFTISQIAASSALADGRGPGRHNPLRPDPEALIGREVAVPVHLEDGAEFEIPLRALLDHGRRLFTANWTVEEGGGRPLTKGTGAPLTDPLDPLVFPRAFNRVSAPDANSCAGCHNAPFGVPGGSGDFVTGVFVLGQRFDFATFDRNDLVPLRGALDEGGVPVTLQTIANYRATIGMFGSGYIEMLAREMTAELQAIRDEVAPGEERALEAKGVSFGRIARDADGRWDTSRVEGLPPASIQSAGPGDPPSLVIRPFHQAGAVVSLREFTNNAFNHHHGIQSTERFGVNTDPDGDGVMNELTRADVTAAVLYQATLPVPGRVIPRHPAVEEAVLRGERLFEEIGCARCHVPSLTLSREGRYFSEPNPYNPPGNLQSSDAPEFRVDLTRSDLPGPRLKLRRGGIQVPAYTDLKLHDITEGPEDPNTEPLDMHAPAGSEAFFAGNRRFLTRPLWGAANQPPYFHHGQFTTLRQAILAHAGEALAERRAFEALAAADRDAVIEFLKTLQVLPPGSRHRIVDEHGRPRPWPPRAHRDREGHGRWAEAGERERRDLRPRGHAGVPRARGRR